MALLLFHLTVLPPQSSGVFKTTADASFKRLPPENVAAHHHKHFTAAKYSHTGVGLSLGDSYDRAAVTPSVMN